MRNTIKSLSFAKAALLSLSLLAPLSFAGADAVPVMADILTKLNHYPSAEQKEQLNAIASDATNSEATRTIAKAIHNIAHKVAAEDAKALSKITTSETATEAEKQLAGIVAGINHTVSADAKKTLEALATPAE